MSNATASTGKICSICQLKHNKSDYSNSQWQAPAEKRRCAACINAKNIVNAPASAVTASSTATATATAASIDISSNIDNTDLPELLLDDDDNWFIPDCESALIEIFNRFDIDKDNVWTVAEIQLFALSTAGREFTTDEISELQDNMQCTDNGSLTQLGFLNFYHLQTSANLAETWKDLIQLGYNKQLKLIKPNNNNNNNNNTTTATATSTDKNQNN